MEDVSEHLESEPQTGSPAWLALLAALTLVPLILLAIVSLVQVFREAPIGAQTGAGDPQGADSDFEQERSGPVAADSVQPACQPQQAIVAHTGGFSVAKLRAEPGFGAEQAASVPRGFELTVCDVESTPGKNIPNRWFRVTSGQYTGLWIHAQVLEFR